MIDFLLRILVNASLWLRYRIRVRGLDEVARRGTTGILFLPNHPALIDPIIMGAVLLKDFHPGFLADQNQIDRFLIRTLARRAGAKPIPDVAKEGPAAAQRIHEALGECIDDLRAGRNVLLYPSGHVYRGRYEDLRGNSAVETILQELPDVRVVVVRTTGLWGSMFSWASGMPNVGASVRRAMKCLLLNGLLFGPRRTVNMLFQEADDLPRGADRETLNHHLETFYNADAPPHTFVPYTWWDRGGVHVLPEPSVARHESAAAAVPETTRRIVLDYLEDLSGESDLGDDAHLARDLGLDSLDRGDVAIWLGTEFGFGEVDVEAIETVGDVMLAACGEAASAARAQLEPVPSKWFAASSADRAAPLAGTTVPEVFLRQARRRPGRVIAADQASGARTYRDVVLAVMLLKRKIADLPGDRVGILLPAGIGADVIYLATLFAGKTPVMVNWTVGPRNAVHSLDLVGVQSILTARVLVQRLEAAGTEFGELPRRFVYLEDIRRTFSRGAKLLAWLRSRTTWASLLPARPAPHAAILFTSGSESLPKAVPLTHENILTNLRDAANAIHIRHDDVLLGMLPPFHSFGLTIGTMLPLTLGVRVVHHPNPTDSRALGAITEVYKATILAGTPTFLAGIVRRTTPEQLSTVRLLVTGAEKCPQRLYDVFAERCPQATVLEGYGVTECSPVVSINREDDPRTGTIGTLLPSVQGVVVDVDTGAAVPDGATGVLLVRGPSIFEGYLEYDGPPPFVEFDGEQWYRTGDLVTRDADGIITFAGRLKRFVKLGGEMVSLPAVESVLMEHYARDTDEGPVLAVEAGGDEARPELVLFTVRDIPRDEANRRIREAGLSALHNIRRVVRVEELPLLGTGKTNYRALKALLADT